MRTLKLTHEQIAIIQNALGIDEKVYSDLHKEEVQIALVRGNEANRGDQEITAKAHCEISTSFANLNINLANGDLDV